MVAERMKRVKGSPTVGLAGRVAELRAQGEDVISLAAGEPDFPTPVHIVQAAKEALDQGFTKYTPSPGIPELREAIAEQSASRDGIPARAENVLVSSTKHALFASMMAFAGPGDEVLVSDPGWVSYLPMVHLAGATPVPVPTPEEGGFALTPEAVAERITPRTRLLVVNTPNNPTGAVYGLAALRGLADLAEDHDFLILTDEIYERMVYEGQHHAVASFPGAFERTVTVNGFSKTYSMTGWRLGWAVAPVDLLKPINTVQQHSITCATSFAQKGGVAALRGPQEPLEAMVGAFARRRDLVVEGLNAIPGLQCAEPPGTFYAWVRYEEDLDSVAMAERILEKARVAVIPGVAFGKEGEGRLRLSFATSTEDLKRALVRLREVLG
ncbi:MAG: pyridoxal phosphate-dependent aminotransferase [Thermoplasmata archaeon]